jgi:hypothetical protein
MKKKPDDYDSITYYPVPMTYFMNLKSKDFWKVYVHKYEQNESSSDGLDHALTRNIEAVSRVHISGLGLSG